MALKYRSTARFSRPDPVYDSELLSKFINCLMMGGKKSVAEQIVYEALDIVDGRVEDEEPLDVFEEALDNVKPVIETRSRRIGGMTYQVPAEVPPRRQTALAIRWMLEAARGVSGRPIHLRLAEEIVDAYRKEGTVYTRRENTHRMAEANRDFSHFSR
ncbi:MAG: 30S ribosomal protein S7 [Planctomycetota bacterium]